ncbi:MAG TPA: gamma-glutamylcyclotransferase family protein [Noviherbaspirillum sp.]|nr:gamma-glutamylcyclotransferase family protein [Noviherbaspirillum sp.]
MHIFTYGSLMFSEVWQRVVPGSHASVPARLPGYRRSAIRGVSYPGIAADDSAQVDGRLYLDVAAEDLAALDRFEGGEYARVAVSVVLEDGARFEAQAYVYLYPDKLTGAVWDPGHFDCAHFLRFEA